MEAVFAQKLLTKIERRFNKTSQLSAEETKALQHYYRLEQQSRYTKIGASSILATTVLVASRVGQNTKLVRLIKLGFYLSTPLAIYQVSKRID